MSGGHENEPPARQWFELRRIGAASLTAVRVGTFHWAPQLQAPEADWRRALPEADAAGRVPIDVNVILIELGDAAILVDPGFDDPDSAWAQHAAAQWPGLTYTPGLPAALDAIGIRPEQITHLLITHAHGDHFAGVTVERDGRLVARFPNAHHLLGRADWEDNPARERPDSDLATRLGTIERLGMLDLVDGDREVVPGVAMVHAPGETPGHSIVRAISGDERFYALGDLFHHPCEFEHPEWVSAGRDRVAMQASRERLLAEAASSRATLVFAHAPFPPWGRVVSEDAGYRWTRLR